MNTQAQWIHLHGPQKGSAGQQAYGHRWRIVFAVILVKHTVPRQLVLVICWGKAKQHSRGKEVPTCRTRHTHVVRALKSSFSLLPKLTDLSRRTGSLENQCRDFKLFVCFIPFYCHTSTQASTIIQYDCTGSCHTHIKSIYFLLCYTKWYITLFSFAFQLATYWLGEHFWASPSYTIIFIISHF